MRLITFLFLVTFTIGFAQNDVSANEYFKNGDFEKALYAYKKLYAKSPSNINYIKQIVDAHQQLEQYEACEDFLLKIIAFRVFG